MKYPCNIIQDLLPLYHDNVCSEESRRAVQQHLPECEACRDYLAALDRPDAAFALPEETSEEQKAASFRSFHQRLEKKQRLFGWLYFWQGGFCEHSLKPWSAMTISRCLWQKMGWSAGSAGASGTAAAR